MTKSNFIQGQAQYAKILGKAPPGYENGPAEWTFDLVLDENGVTNYLKSGADKFYIKTDPNTGKQYIRFKRKAVKADGTDAKPIAVVGPDGKTPWDQTKLIGNGSVLNVKFALSEIEHKKQKRLKPSVIAVQVWEHVPYEGGGFKANPTAESGGIGVEEWSAEE